MYKACNSEANDKRLIYYDWLADSAMTSHVTYQRDIFCTYTPIVNSVVTGVGGKQAPIFSQGTVELNLTYGSKDYILRLKDILYIPGQKNNLISLGRWDAAGRRYIGGSRNLTSSQRTERRWPKERKYPITCTRCLLPYIIRTPHKPKTKTPECS
jgi:hypothetical protein